MSKLKNKTTDTNAIIAAQTDEHKTFDTPEQMALHRPETWIGSRKTALQDISVFEDGQFTTKELELIPAVAKLIEEVIVNSVDEHGRTKDGKLRGWTLDKINIKLQEDGHLTVTDNGGITSKLHSSGLYPIEVIFGQLFSSSNYDDTVQRTTVGKNGVGSALTNLFSKRFTAISSDTVKKVEVTWTENKSIKSEAIAIDSNEHFTSIDCDLDLEYFGIDAIPYGIMKYIERLSMILAASNPGLEVTFNDDVFKFSTFLEYVNLYGLKDVIGEKNESWEIYLAPANGQEAKRYAIVNGAECNQGTHINHIEMLVNWHMQQMMKREKITNITAQMIKSSYHVFINMSVDKPDYTSQSKNELTNEIYRIVDGKKKNLVRSIELQKQIETGKIAQSIIEMSKAKDNELNSKDFQKRAKELKGTSAKTVKKLLDAGEQKRTLRRNCVLWIFEGESAGSGFRPNRSPQTQGCYFLKGKCVNSINMNTMKIMNNQEFSDIIVALGLNPRNPEDLSGLRYGQINVCTDMDYDGYSIFGQLMTMFAIHFPELINQGLVHRVISPLWKCTKGSEVKYFYNNVEYDQFSQKNKGYRSRYFKGIGSLEKSDYKEMLQNTILEKYQIDDNCLNIIHAFMGSDSKPRKRLLETTA